MFPKSADFTIDLYQEHLVVGLDMLIHNRGAASLTVKIDESEAKTVEAGDVFGWDNTKYSLVKVVSAVAYDLVVGGVSLRGLRL